MSVERRRFVRIDAKLHVKIDKTFDELGDSFTKNICKEGICIVTKQLLNPGEVINLDIELNDKRTISTVAEVVWVKDLGNLRGLGLDNFNVGIKFVKISKEDSNEFHKFIFESLNP